MDVETPDQALALLLELRSLIESNSTTNDKTQNSDHTLPALHPGCLLTANPIPSSATDTDNLSPILCEKRRKKDKNRDGDRIWDRRRCRSHDRYSRRDRDRKEDRDRSRDRDRSQSRSPLRRSQRIPLKNRDKDHQNGVSGSERLSKGQLSSVLKSKAESESSASKIEAPELEEGARTEQKQKRSTRWGKAAEKPVVPGMPTTIPANLSEQQRRAYLLELHIEECTKVIVQLDVEACKRKLWEPGSEQRLLSPGSVSSTGGAGLNKDEAETKERLERERHEAMTELLKINPSYKAPQSKKLLREKVRIPQDKYPEVDFAGLLLGRQGSALKALENETGANLIIRGKTPYMRGGKIGVKFGVDLPGANEPLHAYITAYDPRIIKRAREKIKEIIQLVIGVPGEQNEPRKSPLREVGLSKLSEIVSNSNETCQLEDTPAEVPEKKLLHEKIWIPQDDHPGINFVGLLLGLGGHRLRSLEKEVGAKIIISGKGLKVRADEPLHAFITSPNPEIIRRAGEKINQVIKRAIDGKNNEMRQQLQRGEGWVKGMWMQEDVLSGGKCKKCGAITPTVSWELCHLCAWSS